MLTGSLNLLFADWHVERFTKERLTEASAWLPPKVIWNPDAGKPQAATTREQP